MPLQKTLTATRQHESNKTTADIPTVRGSILRRIYIHPGTFGQDRKLRAVSERTRSIEHSKFPNKSLQINTIKRYDSALYIRQCRIHFLLTIVRFVISYF
ncbi:hypothetical protein BDFB_004335 [Asbolus verrucosus]|uniref:Uncharacterized protein n=1 Tax=Asbolus verrucosus TaxID=1661398 RepID=A0A482VJ23_ASBVE|nr:hypothetical protein BDFB_004335 [Asbolus verrucosus]